jgi:hypothetical protein
VADELLRLDPSPELRLDRLLAPQTELLDCTDDAILRNLDTPAAWAAWQGTMREGQSTTTPLNTEAWPPPT